VNDATHQILTAARLPARVNAEAAAALLGFMERDLTILAAADLLKPLGKPSRQSPKFYASDELVRLAGDRKWLDKATKAVGDKWAERNLKYKQAQQQEAA